MLLRKRFLSENIRYMRIDDLPDKPETAPATIRLYQSTLEKIEFLKEKKGKNKTVEWLRQAVDELVEEEYKELVG